MFVSECGVFDIDLDENRIIFVRISKKYYLRIIKMDFGTLAFENAETPAEFDGLTEMH